METSLNLSCSFPIMLSPKAKILGWIESASWLLIPKSMAQSCDRGKHLQLDTRSSARTCTCRNQPGSWGGQDPTTYSGSVCKSEQRPVGEQRLATFLLQLLCRFHPMLPFPHLWRLMLKFSLNILFARLNSISTSNFSEKNIYWTPT